MMFFRIMLYGLLAGLGGLIMSGLGMVYGRYRHRPEIEARAYIVLHYCIWSMASALGIMLVVFIFAGLYHNFTGHWPLP